ncbi:hypothetical protein RclHR1_09130010 [Rhizophagus clarus]|uniref:Yeast cell wall synthesis Kre9/Knh1-like N-terminal domain-containing protein n=1 Tax=Rhizophagus clarus TaxID=94130 RepID=A0A2Z6SGW9_9GLOM|nr:hypothetical protein RclHR1_09130010 [Rhizophagus clarus]GES88839.1 hypothetical protein GLOIN_2v1547579 [Rhizophagus clarus]
MKQSLFSLVLCLLLFSVVIEANILPIVNTTSICSSKKPCELRWVEDGTTPKLTQLQSIDIKLMTGPNNNQIQIMDLGTVSPTIGKVNYNISPNLGPPGRYYFYKFTSGTVEVWSRRFVIQDITGTIPGFDPTTINAQGDVINVQGNNSTSPTSSSSILLSNSLTTIGLSIISMMILSYLC